MEDSHRPIPEIIHGRDPWWQNAQYHGPRPSLPKVEVAAKTCDYCGGTGKVNFGIITGERSCPKCNI